MILLAALAMAPLAPGCRRIEGAIRCELAPPVSAAPPPRRVASVETPPPRRAHPAASSHRPAKKSAPKPSSAPPTSAEVAHHVDLLVAAADCTGARTLVAATESPAAAETLFRTCVGTATRPAPSGHDPHAAPTETALGTAKAVQRPR